MENRIKQMKIDAEKFAYTVISSHNVEGDVMEEIAKKHKLDVVFNAATLVWVAKNSPNIVDLTPDLIKQYNVKHTIKAPATPAKGKVEKKPAPKE